MAFPPDAFLIGAQKAGTTTLAFLLDQHPRVTVSSPKETHYLTGNWDRGLDWYRRCFDGPEDTVFLDATPSYTSAPVPGSPGYTGLSGDDPRPRVPERMHRLNPSARLIYSLRDPVTRTYSSYWHEVRAGRERRPFAEAIRSMPLYLSASDYGFQIERYLDHFPREQLLFVEFEELARDSVGVARRCLTFLGIGADRFAPSLAAARNPSYRYNRVGRILASVAPSKAALVAASRAVRTIVPERYHWAVRAMIARDVPPMNDDDRAFLADYFRERNRRLRTLTGLALAQWQV